MGIAVMGPFSFLCHYAHHRLIGFFSTDPQVIAIGGEYLRIVSWTFVASGIVFVASSMFQAMGNTIPPLITSFARLLLVMVPAIILSRANGFTLTWIWYLSACAIGAQMLLNLALLRREFRGKLEG
jgi:Na+-driven multidrug efflux pump